MGGAFSHDNYKIIYIPLIQIIITATEHMDRSMQEGWKDKSKDKYNYVVN